jgi:flagellar hook-associated protein 2
MGQIQSSVGLLSGFPVQDTVDKLIQIASIPMNNLQNETKTLQSEQTADTTLSSLLLALQFEGNQLGSSDLYNSTQATSSNNSALLASVPIDGNPTPGAYFFTPLQTASAQQYFSQDFGASDAVGAGTLTLQTGGFVDQGISLDQLNGGAGVSRGQIRITDRSGDSAAIDLSGARTIDDVLAAINNNTGINVTASVVGDKIKLTDNTGGSGNLVVKDLAGGSTAASLGLAGINTNSASALGADIFSLSTKTKLSTLNDGTGVRTLPGANDLSVSLADGSTVAVDLDGAQSLGDVINKINATGAGKLTAAIAADGNRLQLTDNTTGSGTFAVSNVSRGTAASDLGLTVSASDSTISGRRLVSGLADTLLSSLNGGQGVGTLGSIAITNRAGVLTNVDLSSAETLGDVVAAINSQATGVTASINHADNGIVITDTTGSTSHNLSLANGDTNNSATALHLVSNVAADSVDSGTLNRKQVSEATLLTSIKSGVTPTDIIVTDSAGHVGAIDLNTPGNPATTLGDVIDRINAAGIGVVASINANGDGIQLKDTANGSATLTVKDAGSGTTAKDSGIAGSATTQTINNTPTQIIDGTQRATVSITSTDTLADVVKKINALNDGVTASVLNDGNSQRLSLKVNNTGAANAVLVDASGSSLALQQVSPARDAVLLYGSSGSNGGVLLSSPTNNFNNVVDGLNLTVQGASSSPVAVTVASTSSDLVNTVTQFVSAYNSIRDNLDKNDTYDATTQTTGILFGTSTALHADTDLSNLITGQYFGVGNFQTLADVGLTLDSNNHLVFDQSKLTDALNSDPQSVEKLFTDKTNGVAAKFNNALNNLAGNDNSILSTRLATLNNTIQDNNDRITQMQARLNTERDQLTAQYQQIDQIVAKYQTDLAALESFQPIAPLGSSGSSNSSKSNSSPLNFGSSSSGSSSSSSSGG